MMTGRSGWRSLNLRQQLKAALPGQRQIEKHEIEVLAIEQAQPSSPSGCRSHSVAFEMRQHFKRLANAGLVVDHQDAEAPGGLPLMPLRIGCVRRSVLQRCYDLRHERNSSTGETQDETWCRRRPRSRRGFCRRAPE